MDVITYQVKHKGQTVFETSSLKEAEEYCDNNSWSDLCKITKSGKQINYHFLKAKLCEN